MYFSLILLGLYTDHRKHIFRGSNKIECNTRPFRYGVALMPYYELSIEDARHYPAGTSGLSG